MFRAGKLVIVENLGEETIIAMIIMHFITIGSGPILRAKNVQEVQSADVKQNEVTVRWAPPKMLGLLYSWLVNLPLPATPRK